MPDEAAFRASWVPVQEFQQMIGPIFWDQKKFLGTSGGVEDPDSFRGFSATSGNYEIPTATGWTVWRTDNPNWGRGITGALSPEGEEWEWITIGYSFKEFFVRASDHAAYKAAFRAAIESRHEYYYDRKHPAIPLRFGGWHLQEGTWWIRENGVERDRLRLNCDTDRILLFEKPSPPWWREDITIWEIF